jgi:hypothetical protein
VGIAYGFTEAKPAIPVRAKTLALTPYRPTDSTCRSSSVVERVLGKNEVGSPILPSGSVIGGVLSGRGKHGSIVELNSHYVSRSSASNEVPSLQECQLLHV